jgi:hypothetical protein
MTFNYLRGGGVPQSIGNLLMRAAIFFRPHLNQIFAQEVMGFQNRKILNFENFKIPKLGVLGKNDIWV